MNVTHVCCMLFWNANQQNIVKGAFYDARSLLVNQYALSGTVNYEWKKGESDIF